MLFALSVVGSAKHCGRVVRHHLRGLSVLRRPAVGHGTSGEPNAKLAHSSAGLLAAVAETLHLERSSPKTNAPRAVPSISAFAQTAGPGTCLLSQLVLLYLSAFAQTAEPSSCLLNQVFVSYRSPSKPPRQSARPNPSLHPTVNSRLRRLSPAGELKR